MNDSTRTTATSPQPGKQYRITGGLNEPSLLRGDDWADCEVTPIRLTLYTDPGHGWLQVPIKLLQELGIERQITTFSYQRGADAYLEEDCDLSTFVTALERAGSRWAWAEKATGSEAYIFDTVDGEHCSIRSYEPFGC